LEYLYSDVSRRMVKSEIRELLKWIRKPGVISFGGGLPDPVLFPCQEIAEITQDVLAKKGYLALQYGPTRGEPEMLDSLEGYMKVFGEEAKQEQICITSSSQQALDLLSHLFIDKGEPVIIELPSYLGAIQAFARCGADMRGIPLDANGLDINHLKFELKKLKKSGKKPRFIYTIPDFQNPSGITLSIERRKELVQIARDNGIPLIEDSPYKELSFTGEVLPSLWTIAGGKGVIMLKTFSKKLFPGMRMGWIVAETPLIEKIEMIKQSVDLCTPSFTQFILSEYISRGSMRQKIADAIHCYKSKIKAMLEALESYMPQGVSWSKPSGGVFVWAKLPKHLDAKEIFPIAFQHKVAYVIGQPFHCNGSGANTLRLNYSFPSSNQIETGVQRLAKAIESVLS
jgi:2-aminoadipate transaminase